MSSLPKELGGRETASPPPHLILYNFHSKDPQLPAVDFRRPIAASFRDAISGERRHLRTRGLLLQTRQTSDYKIRQKNPGRLPPTRPPHHNGHFEPSAPPSRSKDLRARGSCLEEPAVLATSSGVERNNRGGTTCPVIRWAWLSRHSCHLSAILFIFKCTLTQLVRHD